MGIAMSMVQETTRVGALPARRAGSHWYEIVADPAGGFRIAMDGEVISCFHWKQAEWQDCVKALHRLAGDGAEFSHN